MCFTENKGPQKFSAILLCRQQSIITLAQEERKANNNLYTVEVMVLCDLKNLKLVSVTH